MQVIKPAKTRTEEESARLTSQVADIIKQVRTEGDAALRHFNAAFDGCYREDLRVSREEIEAAYAKVSEQEVADMQAAAANIRAFAKAQRGTMGELSGFATVEGADLGHRIIPVESACCYVPGGNYPLYSTALMLGIPARVAGVGRVIGCSPVVKGTDQIHPKTLVAMDIAGMDEIYAVGGAIAAAAYGTDTIAPVNIIVGPGNAFVTEAKKQCYGKVGIDFLAGPSEVMILNDGSGDPAILAADILAQSEHDVMAKGILITTCGEFAGKVIAEVESQLELLDTKEIAAKSWADYGEVLLAEDMAEAVAYANSYAPEHLEVIVDGGREHEESIAGALRNYGSLFLGQNTAEVFGDYASGTNHTLPTMAAAKYTGGVFVGTFLKTCTYQRFSDAASKALAPLVQRLAEGEGLSGHAAAAAKRK